MPTESVRGVCRFIIVSLTDFTISLRLISNQRNAGFNFQVTAALAKTCKPGIPGAQKRLVFRQGGDNDKMANLILRTLPQLWRWLCDCMCFDW